MRRRRKGTQREWSEKGKIGVGNRTTYAICVYNPEGRRRDSARDFVRKREIEKYYTPSTGHWNGQRPPGHRNAVWLANCRNQRRCAQADQSVDDGQGRESEQRERRRPDYGARWPEMYGNAEGTVAVVVGRPVAAVSGPGGVDHDQRLLR